MDLSGADEAFTRDLLTSIYYVVYPIAVLIFIYILASIAVDVTCIVIVAIGRGWKKLKTIASNFNSRAKYKVQNPTEIVYYHRYT